MEPPALRLVYHCHYRLAQTLTSTLQLGHTTNFQICGHHIYLLHLQLHIQHLPRCTPFLSTPNTLMVEAQAQSSRELHN